MTSVQRPGGKGDRDRAFTLVELLVVVAMLGIVTVALSATIVVFLRNSDDLSDKLGASHAALLTTRYLPSDLQSVEPGGVDTAATGFTAVCGVTPNVLALSWTDLATSPSTRYDAIYVLDGTDINRVLCVDGVVNQSHAVAHNVAAATATLTGPELKLTITTVGTEADPSGLTYSILTSRRS